MSELLNGIGTGAPPPRSNNLVGLHRNTPLTAHRRGKGAKSRPLPVRPPEKLGAGGTGRDRHQKKRRRARSRQESGQVKSCPPRTRHGRARS